MKYLILFIIILTTTSFNVTNYHKATYYPTEKHKKVHRSHPTCAYNLADKKSMLLVTNIRTGKSCIVEVTDRMSCKHQCWKTKKCHIHDKKIDLSIQAFGLIETDYGKGVCDVIVTKLNENKNEQKQRKPEPSSKESNSDTTSNR